MMAASAPIRWLRGRVRKIGGGENGDWLRVREGPVLVFSGSRRQRRERGQAPRGLGASPRSLDLALLACGLRTSGPRPHPRRSRETSGRTIGNSFHGVSADGRRPECDDNRGSGPAGSIRSRSPTRNPPWSTSSGRLHTAERTIARPGPPHSRRAANGHATRRRERGQAPCGLGASPHSLALSRLIRLPHKTCTHPVNLKSEISNSD